MMEYRQLPRGEEREKLSVIGLGLNLSQAETEREMEEALAYAIEHGINFFDLCALKKSAHGPFARAIAGVRDKVFFQLHWGAVYNEKGEYGWSRDPDEIKRSIQWELDQLKTDYVDFGFLHCIDQHEDFDKLKDIGIVEELQNLKKQGFVRHIGFSSHTPDVAQRVLDAGIADMMMFSINPAYDFEQSDGGVGGDKTGSASERMKLFQRCAAEGVGISVMKPFHGGKLLSADTSPFHRSLTWYQCLQYALDRPGVLTTVPGVRGLQDIKDVLGFVDATAEERDYSVIGSFTAEQVMGQCVYCDHCLPCPAGIDVGLVNKYYDLARVGDKLAAGHYEKLAVKAGACLQCGHCDSRCPFRVKQGERMKEIAAYFGG